MLSALIHERSYRSLRYIFDPATHQPESLAGEVFDIRREIELTVEPRFHCVLVR